MNANLFVSRSISAVQKSFQGTHIFSYFFAVCSNWMGIKESLILFAEQRQDRLTETLLLNPNDPKRPNEQKSKNIWRKKITHNWEKAKHIHFSVAKETIEYWAGFKILSNWFSSFFTIQYSALPSCAPNRKVFCVSVKMCAENSFFITIWWSTRNNFGNTIKPATNTNEAIRNTFPTPLSALYCSY